MGSKLYPSSKALLLISNNHFFDFVKTELISSGFEVEEQFHMVQHCKLVILDHFYLQAGIADYLNKQKIQKTFLLVLTQTQISSEKIQPEGLFQDILVARDYKGWGPKYIISARAGETTFEGIFENYLPKFLSPPQKKQEPVYQLSF